MQSSTVELQLQLGESLESEVDARAKAQGLSPEKWVAYFLARGRLTPEERADLISIQS